MELVVILIRTIFFYFLIFLIYRIMGKREVGQLGIIDLVVSILIAELVVISIENYDNNLLTSIIPIIVLTILQKSLAFLSLKKPKFRNFLDGTPSVIIKNGKINYQEMIKQKYNLDDLLIQMREKECRSIEEVEYAILENNGTLSIFKYENNETPLPLPLILDGLIQEDTLNHLNKDKKWVLKILERKDLLLEDIFYAFYKDKNVFIIKNSDLI